MGNKLGNNAIKRQANTEQTHGKKNRDVRSGNPLPENSKHRTARCSTYDCRYYESKYPAHRLTVTVKNLIHEHRSHPWKRTTATKSHDTVVITIAAATLFVFVNLVVWRMKRIIPVRVVVVYHVANTPWPSRQTPRTSMLTICYILAVENDVWR